MTKYINAGKLIAEIERQIQNLRGIAVDNPMLAQTMRLSFEGLLSFIASLQQERQDLPGIEESGIPGKDYIPVEWVDACEKYGKWKIVKKEQPEVDLEKVARNVYESWMGGTMNNVRRDMVELGKILNARKEDSK